MKTEDLKVLLIDDEISSLEASKIKLSMYVSEENIYTASNAVEVLRAMNSIPVNIAFVDVEMPETDGFAIIDYIRQSQPKTQVVFLTGHVELGAKSYDYEPLDFLSKPLDVLRLKRTFEKYERAAGVSGEKREQLALKGANGFMLIAPAEIFYIAHVGRKNVLHMESETCEVRTSLDELELMLGEYGLFRCHQSFIVSLRQIRSVSQSDFGRTFTAHLLCGEDLPVSRGKYPLLCEELSRKGIRFI